MSPGNSQNSPPATPGPASPAAVLELRPARAEDVRRRERGRVQVGEDVVAVRIRSARPGSTNRSGGPNRDAASTTSCPCCARFGRPRDRRRGSAQGSRRSRRAGSAARRARVAGRRGRRGSPRPSPRPAPGCRGRVSATNGRSVQWYDCPKVTSRNVPRSSAGMSSARPRTQLPGRIATTGRARLGEHRRLGVEAHHGRERGRRTSAPARPARSPRRASARCRRGRVARRGPAPTGPSTAAGRGRRRRRLPGTARTLSSG